MKLCPSTWFASGDAQVGHVLHTSSLGTYAVQLPEAVHKRKRQGFSAQRSAAVAARPGGLHAPVYQSKSHRSFK